MRFAVRDTGIGIEADLRRARRRRQAAFVSVLRTEGEDDED